MITQTFSPAEKAALTKEIQSMDLQLQTMLHLYNMAKHNKVTPLYMGEVIYYSDIQELREKLDELMKERKRMDE